MVRVIIDFVGESNHFVIKRNTHGGGLGNFSKSRGTLAAKTDFCKKSNDHDNQVDRD